MKSLKFHTILIPLILSKRKTSTWRLFDDKELKEGDIVNFINNKTLGKFAKAELTNIKIKKFKDLTENDWKGHEEYSSDKEMYKKYTKYYKKPINGETELKIISFRLITS
ncbi:ASCH domain-containing protein [Candidatus Woesearchaeota archaeon]|nr:ASCH domain-containing protein [Candidatus Woesearchaeota archaeon]